MTILLSIWIVSIFIMVVSFYKNKFISIIDLTLVFSYFHIFLRPILNPYCGTSSIYLDSGDLYNQMTIFGGIFIVIFQLGMLIARRRFGNIGDMPLLYSRVYSLFTRFTIISSGFVLLLLLVCFYLYGLSFMSWFRDPGRWTVQYSFAGFSFYLIKALSYYAIPLLSVLIMFYKKNKFNIALLIFLILSLFAFGKRGALISPVLLSIFMVSFFRINGYKFLHSSRWFFLGISTFVIVAALFSRGSIFAEGYNICTLNKIGQDYDQIWPLIYVFSESLEWPFLLAIDGVWNTLMFNFEQRMSNELYNITDLLMILSNLKNYTENGFGVTPYFSQFYFVLFGFSSLILAFLLGFICKKAEFKVALSAVNARLIGIIFYIFIIHFLMNSWDYKIKILLLELFVGMLIVYLSKVKIKY
jgi:hypothetical protein